MYMSGSKSVEAIVKDGAEIGKRDYELFKAGELLWEYVFE